MAPIATAVDFASDIALDTSEISLTRWLSRRQYHSSDFSLGELAEVVASSGQKITVIVPAKQVADTVGAVIDVTIAPLVRAGIVSSVVAVVTSARDDRTASVAAAHGARLVYREDIAPELGPSLGKGDALWRGLQATDGDIVAFLDGDTGDPSPAHLIGILGPLIMEPKVKMVRGCFDRPFKKEGCLPLPNEGGRVTELTARPLLNLHWPALAGFSQPLAGEFGARRTLLEKLPFPVGYGVEIATLVDTFEREGLDALAQVDLGTRQNAHKSLRDLTTMSYAILSAVEKRIGRVSDVGNKMFIPWKGAFISVPTIERPSIHTYGKIKRAISTTSTLGVPFVSIQGVDNFRDAGSQVVAERKFIRTGLIYRSAAFSKLTTLGRHELDKLGIKYIYDLRSNVELTHSKQIHGGLTSSVVQSTDFSSGDGMPDWKQWEREYHAWANGDTGPLRIHVPTFMDCDFSASATARRLEDYADPTPEGFARIYTIILSQLGPCMAVLLTHLATDPIPGPFVIHCTAGKDRTGAAIMLLLLLAGASPAVIALEYALSGPGLATWRPDTIERLMGNSNPALHGNRTAAENVTSARERNMLATIEAFYERWGSIEQWMKEVAGLDEELLDRARRKMLLVDENCVMHDSDHVYGIGDVSSRRHAQEGMCDKGVGIDGCV